MVNKKNSFDEECKAYELQAKNEILEKMNKMINDFLLRNEIVKGIAE